MLVSSIVGFNFGSPSTKLTSGSVGRSGQSGQNQNSQAQNNMDCCGSKGRKHSSNKIHNSNKLSISA